MIIKIKIHEYIGQGIHLEWEDDHRIWTRLYPDRNVMIIEANHAGLVSLARHMLTLAQNNVPAGSHIHLDDGNSLEKGSCELILERVEG